MPTLMSLINAARQVILPTKEERLAKDPMSAYQYAFEQKYPFLEGEDAIASDARTAYLYAKDVLQARFPKGEPTIAKDAGYARLYARDFLGFSQTTKDRV